MGWYSYEVFKNNTYFNNGLVQADTKKDAEKIVKLSYTNNNYEIKNIRLIKK